MKIQRKVATALVVSFIASVLVGALVFVTALQTSENILRLELIGSIRSEIFNRANLLDEYLQYQGERPREQWVLTSKQIDTLISAAKKKFYQPDAVAIFVLLEKYNDTNKQIGVELFAHFTERIDRGASRESTDRLVGRLLIARSEMIKQSNRLGDAVRNEIFLTQRRTGIATVLIVNLLFIIALFNLAWIRAAVKKIEEMGARDEAILSSIGDAVMVCDNAGRIVLFNAVAEVLTGHSMQEAIGQQYGQILNCIRESDEKQGNDFIAKAMRTGAKTEMKNHTLLIRKDGSKIPVADSAAPVMDADGVLIGCVVVFRDTTKEREIDKAKTEFVSLASHQLRAPLTAAKWYIEMLSSGTAGTLNDGQKKYLEEATQSNQNAINLVNTLLNVSRLELGALTMELEPTDVTGLIQGVIDEQRSQIEVKKITIHKRYETHLPLLNVDPKLLHTVFQNLLSNAIKYTSDRGKVDVAIAKNEKGEMLITISDTGCGIPKNQQHLIFTKLFRADNIREKKIEGTGLGLYIVKEVVDRSGGRVWFESEQDKGSTFYVAFPLEGMKKKDDVAG